MTRQSPIVNRNGFDDAEQLDRIAQFTGELDVQRVKCGGCLRHNCFRVDPKTVGERRENADLVRGVVAVNVEVGRGFGITQFLRVGENFGEVRAFELHARQDVIAGAVDDAVERVDAVADKTFAQRFDDGNAAATLAS